MKIRGRMFQRFKDYDGYHISFVTNDSKVADEFFSSKLPGELEVEIKKTKKKRSLSANSYFWVLADELAKKLNSTSVEIYKEIVMRVGVYHELMIDEEDVLKLSKNWSSNGIGWFALKGEQLGKKVIMRLYAGSSTYSVDEMRRLIDELVYECKECGIETITPDEREELLQKWNMKI